ncbi:hypothetical protein ES703_57882 [subsurface metagenome]
MADKRYIGNSGNTLYEAIVEKKLEPSKFIARGENPPIQVHSLTQFPLAVVFEKDYKKREAGGVHRTIVTTVMGRDEDIDAFEQKYQI